MSEKQPIKPEAKKKHHEILRPTTEGHIMTGEIDPELERNQPDNLKEKEKTKLDINSAKFMPKNYKPKTSNQINDNAPKQPNDFKNHVNKYKYSQPHTNNNYGKIMNMNMPPYSNVPYYYPQQMNINQGYPNNNQFSGPNFQNFQNPMNNPNYPPQQQPYPIGYFQNFNNQNMIPQNNNNYNNYNNNYYNRANPNNQKKYNENNKEKNNPLVTKLSLDAKHFIPSYKQKDKDLDINADPYIPRNQNLKKKEEQTHPKKEENQPVKKKESDLSKLLNSMDSEKTKSTHSKASEKKIADIKKKSSKKSDYDKKFEAVSKNKEKLEKEEAEKQKRKKKEEEEKQKKAEEERKRKEEEEKKRKEEEERKRKEEEERKRKRKEEEERRKEEEKKRIEEEKKRKEKEFEERKKREKLKKEEENEIKKNKINERAHLKERSSKSRKNSEKNENNYNNLPKKVYKDEEENDEENSNSNHRYTRGKQYKYSTGKKLNVEEEKRRKQLEKDLEDEINKNEISDENEKNKKNNLNNIKNKEKKEIVINDIANTKLDRSFDAVNTYKKPVQKNLGNGKAKIYRPKRPGGVVRGRSHEKVEAHLLNKIDNDQRITNENSNYVLTSMNSKKLNGNNFINSPNIAYSKKRSIGGIGGDNFVQLNKSFGEYRGPGIENGNNFMNGMYNINTLELSSLPDLNSSFDSRLQSFNSNNFPYGLNSEFYTRTAQKNYHNNTINSGNLANNSNRFTSMNNFFGMNNMGNMSNINGLSYINGDNDNNFINMSNLGLNNNNSFFDLRQPQINPYDLNSSYNLGYNNPLSNYPNNQVNLSNLLSNNFLGLNNNLQRGMSNYNPGNNFPNIFTKKSSSINIEDLLVLEEKLSEISIALNKTKIMNNECFEFWNYYYNCSLYGSLEKLFTNVLDSNNVQISINYILMSLLICYDCSFDVEVLNNVYSVLKELLNLNHKNLMLIYEHILSKISTESRDNIWVLKLLNIVNSSKNSDFNDYNMTNGYSMTLVEKINFNTGIIIQNIRVLLKNFKTPRVEYLTSLFKKINEKSYEDINNFFRQYILRVENINGSILASVFLKDNSEFKSEPAPYLHTINHKKYSLILDLDETLVHFKMNPDNKSEGVLKVRPGVMEFLDAVDKYYELIIFTCATQDYANLLIDAIEENKIYFEHRLYRQHTVIIDNDFVKDLTRIGRPLDKIAIVDNMPQNFRLQKENGINIKAFWGEDIYDTALINLSPILITIAEEGGDIRKGLAKYRDEIVEKVTSNISKHNI